MDKIFTKRLADVMRNKEITQAELSKRTGIRASSISDYIKGKYLPKQDKVALIADALSVNPAWLMGYKPSADLPAAPNILPIKKKKIPLLGKIAAGQPIFADEDHGTYVECDEDAHVDFALRVQGDSMIGARINDGDLVFIRKQDDVEDGEIAAVLIDDDATLKRVYHQPEAVMLVSENPKYAPMIFNSENCFSCRILGKAIFFQSKVR